MDTFTTTSFSSDVRQRNDFHFACYLRTISGSSNASVKELAAGNQVGEDKVEGATETTENTATTPLVPMTPPRELATAPTPATILGSPPPSSPILKAALQVRPLTLKINMTLGESVAPLSSFSDVTASENSIGS